MPESEIDLEREKAESYELGHIAMLEDLAEELRDRAGDQWADSSSRTDVKKAKQLKSLAKEFEERAEKRRKKWEEKFDV